MIKLIDIVKEVQASDRVAVEEVNIGKLARTAATTAAIGLASLGAPKDASAQTQKSPASVTAPAARSTEWRAQRYISNDKIESWNRFQKWLSDTTFEDLDKSYIPTTFKGSGKLVGNKILNQPGYSQMVLSLYTRLHRDYELEYNDIEAIQNQIKDYGDWIATTKQYEEFSETISKIKPDGTAGALTSTIFFPKEYIKALNSKATVNL